tara:strand:- start:4107 stop:5711 length:1605 start_codon:yes stop_codon:yes gene_type:complete
MSTLEYDAVVIGAGIAGLYQLYRLREKGYKVKVIEAGTDIGGTWYWNRYPGARVDSQSHVYQYWFSEELNNEWSWSERFPTQPEQERYLNFIVDRCDLRRDIQFETRVKSASYNEDSLRWIITTDTGETFSTQFLISCGGMLSAPVKPTYPGEEKFKGQMFHTARWPREGVNLAGKRVAVIGAGATGIQVIQTIASEVEKLTVFQRTPQYTIPMNNPKLTDADRNAFKKRFHELKEKVLGTYVGFDYDLDPRSWAELSSDEQQQALEEIWADGSLQFWVGSFFEMFVDEEVNKVISDFVRKKIRQRINDPEVARKLIPTEYGFGLHRVPLETNYYEAYNRDNVELICVKENPVEEVTESAIKTADGQVHEVDIIIFATGFDAATGALTRIDIRGRGGRSIKEEWSKEIRTTLGLQIHGYPNLFTTGAPLAPSAALCNMTTCLQQQVDWITACIEFLKSKEKSEIEASESKQDEWVAHHDEISKSTLLAKTNSWYMGSNVEGKPRRLLSYIGGVNTYHQHCRDIVENDYAGFDLR